MAKKNPGMVFFWLSGLKTLLAVSFKLIFSAPSPGFKQKPVIDNDFFGLNVASQADPKCDDQVIVLCRELGIQHVRLDFCYHHLGDFGERFLQRLIAENFNVLLHLVPPKAAMQRLGQDPQVERDWIAFCKTVVSRYGKQISAMEIGSTPNRKKWSGLTWVRYLRLWQAVKHLDTGNLILAGPNVSDFEPIANIMLLHWMKKLGPRPSIHTENLFVERVREPENFDHRVLGKWVTTFLKLNLVKKARIYQHISTNFGIQKTFCTNTFWQDQRLRRWSDQPAQKKADYLVRYLVIAAASGALDRVYWGPLIGHLDGLLDDQTGYYPDIERVTVYDQVFGDSANLKHSPAFNALKTVVKMLSKSKLKSAQSRPSALNQFIFTAQNGTEIHINWIQDDMHIPLTKVYSFLDVQKATLQDCEGHMLTRIPENITERPLYLVFDHSFTTQQ